MKIRIPAAIAAAIPAAIGAATGAATAPGPARGFRFRLLRLPRVSRLFLPFLAFLPFLLATACGGGSGGTEPDLESATLSVVSGDGVTGLTGVPLPDSLVLSVKDSSGQPLPGVLVRFQAGVGEVSPAIAVSDPQGRAMALFTPGAAGVTDTVKATLDSGAEVRFHISATTAAPGDRTLGRKNYVEYRAGSLPLVISAPHGGTLEPTEIPDRTSGTFVRDLATDDLAFRIATALEARTGERPHLVVDHLHRRKMDANRALQEAAGGNRRAEHAWREFQGFVAHARERVQETHGAGLYIDLHGHGHDIQRLEWGYLLSASELALSDGELDAGTLEGESSINGLSARTGQDFSALLRGAGSLGGRFETLGYPSVPSPAAPHSAGEPYFTGGYNTATWGSRDGGTIFGVQLEANRIGVRDTEESRAAFAAVVAEVLEAVLAEWMGG